MTITRARGSVRSREATSSRHALSTLFRRARFRGKPPEVQVTASGLATAMAFMRTGQSDEAVPPRPSETRTVTVADAGGVIPVLSKVAAAPVPVQRPAEALHPEVRGS